ncbi:MAG TPA: protein kinase [Gemmatimonadaceae bacterium]
MSAKLCPQCGTRYEGDNRFCTLDGATLVLENPSDTLTGALLADRYLIDRKLGEGGMGEVYLAEHIRMKRKVAVKVMRAWLTKDPAAISRFHREAENASQITHPNVAGVYDFGETPEGLVYLAMEFVEGEPLTSVLDREKVINHIRASDIVSQTADALAAAHSLGILHRDLKPDNVMIGRTRARTDLVKLLDFGIARVMGRETQHFTSTGLIVGTPEWMSPEQIAGDQLDARSDIYTLGLIAFRMLTGEGAFSGMTSQEVLLSKMTKSPRRLADARPDVEWPEDLQATMDKVLATDPAARYDDALLFAADFFAGVSKLPMTPAAEEYYNLLTQRAVTPGRLGTIESTPVRGMPSIETPAKPMPRREVNVPQLADTAVLPASMAAGLKSAAVEAPITGTEAAIETPSSVDSAIPTPTVPMPAAPKRRTPMWLVGGVAAVVVIAIAVSQLGGNAATPDATAADSAARIAVGGPDSVPATGGASDSATTARATDSTASDSSTRPTRAFGPALDSVANRHRGSVFSISRARNRYTAFLVDGEGLLLTSSNAIGSAPVVDVFFDGSRRVPGRVVSVDSARGLAAVLVHTRRCPSICNPIALGADRVQFRTGDSVVAMTGSSLVAQGSRNKGALTNTTAQRLTAAVRTGEAGTGAPVFLPDGNLIGVIRNGGGASAMLVPASVARAFVREAQAERNSKNLAAIDSALPSWPSRPLPAAEVASGVRRTTQDLDAFRVRGRGDFEALVMTPQLLALRKAEADTLRKYFNPGSPATMFCDGNGPCDPLEAWSGLNDYLEERRAVVVIQVAPRQLAPPRRGEHARVDMNRRPGLVRIQLRRGNTEVPPIEHHRIMSVVNPGEYPENQRELLYSGLAVFNPGDILEGGNVEILVYHQGREPQRLPVPNSVLEAVRRDLASVLR